MMGQHWRTSRSALGGRHERLTGSPYAQRTQRDSSISFPSGTPLERRQISEPSFDERELGAGVFLFAFFFTIAVGGFVALYALQSFVPQAIEYQIGSKADR